MLLFLKYFTIVFQVDENLFKILLQEELNYFKRICMHTLKKPKIMTQNKIYF